MALPKPFNPNLDYVVFFINVWVNPYALNQNDKFQI